MRATAALLLLASVAAAGCRQGSPPERVILLVVDTLRRDHLPMYGGSARTPHLARLARDGGVHRNAVSSYFQTTMSMSALFSGRTPSLESGDPHAPVRWNAENWCGMARFAGPGDACLPASIPLLGEQMRGQGYWTLGVVANQLLHDGGFERGFDEWIEIPERVPPRAPGQPPDLAEGARRRGGGAVNAAVFAALERRPSDHFFLYVHYMDVHDWYMWPRPYRDMVEEADRHVGALLDHLRRRGLLRDAVVVFTADHGELLGAPHVLPSTPRHLGNPAFQPLLEVPLIVAGAELPGGGGLFRSTDLHRWLVELAGGAPRDDGVLAPDEQFVTERLYRTYRNGRFKSYWRRDDASVRLVDLETDPGELEDASATHPEVLERHRRRIEELSRELAAPRASVDPITPAMVETLRSLGYVE